MESGPSNFEESSSANEKPKLSRKGILKFGNESKSASAKSQFEKSISEKFQANKNTSLSDSKEDEILLDEEKISHLKEEIMV